MLEVLKSSRPSARPSYVQPPRVSEELVRQLLQERPITGEGRFGFYQIPGANPYSDIARAVECNVFHHFFGNTAAVMHEAYGAYEETSLFFLAVDRIAQRPAGAFRVIKNSPRGLKSLNDIAQHPLYISASEVMAYHNIPSLDQCWDFGTVAVLKDYRGQHQDHQVVTMLYGAVIRAALSAGVHHAVLVMDHHGYTQLTQTMAIPLVPILDTEPFEYLGSAKSRAAYVYLPNVRPSAETHLSHLDDTTRRSLRPSVARVIYAEGIPDVVPVP